MNSNLPSDFDPYYRWLGIPKDRRPPTHYQLLGISPTEDDREAIQAAVKRQTSLVKSQREAEHEEVAKRVLYEIQEAGITILDPYRRKKYDASLARSKATPRRRRPTESLPAYTSSRSIGEETEIVRSYFGIVSILLCAFIIMAVVSFMLPWKRVVFGIDPENGPPAPAVALDSTTVKAKLNPIDPPAPAKATGVVSPPHSQPKPAAGAEQPSPRIVEHRTMDWDLSKSDYARYDNSSFDVGLGNAADGWGFGYAGILLDNVRLIELDVTLSSAYHSRDDNSFAGFIVDYHARSGYATRVALSTGFYSQKRWDHAPYWGKHTKSDLIVDLGRNSTYKLDLRKWAPPDWDGRCWFNVCLQNAGNDASLQARITRMTASTGDQHSAAEADRGTTASSEDKIVAASTGNLETKLSTARSQEAKATQRALPQKQGEPKSPFVGKYRLRVTDLRTKQRDRDRIVELRADMTAHTDDGLAGTWNTTGDKLQVEVPGYKVLSSKQQGNRFTGTLVRQDGLRFGFELTKMSGQ